MFSRSSSTSTLSDSAKRHLLTCLPTDSKVLATATAKVYHAPFNTKTDGAGWTFSGMSGTLVFGRARTILHADRPLGESIQHEHWFRLVDPIKGLVWIHQIPDTLDYAPDKPFFHVFAGKSRMFGFLFEDDAEAARFLRKVSTHVRTSTAGSPAPRKGTVARKISLGLGVGRQARRLTPGMVSGPAKGTFVHVGHVGFDAAGRVEATDSVEPGWAVMLGELSGGRIDGLDGFFKGVPTSTPKAAAGPLKSDGALLRGPEAKRGPVHRKPVVKFA